MSDARIVELVDARRQHSLRYNYSLFNKIISYYNTYRGVWQGHLSQFRNNITIPFTFAMIQSDVARKVQTSFGAWPIVTFEGYAPEDVPTAKKREVLISAQMKDCKSISKAVDFFLSADICGTAISRYGWKNITRKQRYRRNETIAPGLTIPVMYEDDTTVFNGPNWETIDRLDFWQQPAIKRIDDMDWVIHRYWMDLDAIREDANSPYPYFDPHAIKLLESAPPGSSAMDQYNSRKLAFRNEYDYQMRQSERFAKPVEIWEMHGLVPREFAPDGVRNRCIAIGNGRVVMKNRESILPSGQKMFLSFSPMSDPYSFDGVGKAEIAFGPQQTANRLNNQKLDALDQLIDPMWVVSATAGINFQNLFTRAGRIVTVDGDAGDSAIRPLSPDLRGVQAAYAEIAQLFNFMQLGTGETEALMGGSGSQRETARGFLGRQENALTRLAMEAKLAEQDMIEPLADGFVALDRQFLPMPYMPRIIGSLALTNPITGLPYPQERVTIDQDDMVPDYAARAVGASQMMGRSLRQQNFVSLFQIMGASQPMLQLVNWYAFARQAFELFDFKNVDELLVQQQIPLTNQIAMQAGQSPESVAGAVSQPIEQLSPEILGMLSGAQSNANPMAMMTG